MKKQLRILLSTLTLGTTMLVSGCNKINQNLVDKINAAAATSKTEDDYTFTQLTKKLGSPESDVTLSGYGVMSWSETKKNVKTTLTVTFSNYVATHAAISEEEITEEK